MLISKEVEFDAGHRVATHKSKCRSPHGHRYRVQAVIEGDIITDESRSDYGMLVDFSDLKEMMMELIHDPLDHAMIIWKDDGLLRGAMERDDWKVFIMDYIPTAENIARWCWERLEAEIIAGGWEFKLFEVCVWETPTSPASCHEEDIHG